MATIPNSWTANVFQPLDAHDVALTKVFFYIGTTTPTDGFGDATVQDITQSQLSPQLWNFNSIPSNATTAEKVEIERIGADTAEAVAGKKGSPDIADLVIVYGKNGLNEYSNLLAYYNSKAEQESAYFVLVTDDIAEYRKVTSLLPLTSGADISGSSGANYVTVNASYGTSIHGFAPAEA